MHTCTPHHKLEEIIFFLVVVVVVVDVLVVVVNAMLFALFLLLYSGVRLYLSVCDDGECIVLRADTTRMLMDKASSTHFYKRARFARAGICFKCEEEFMINDTFQPYSFFFFLVVSSFSSILSFK